MKTTCIWALGAAILIATASHAGAQPARPQTQTQRQRSAQAHFEKGREFFTFGAYDQAIREYEAAYAVLPLADFLFNIGQVYRTKGDRVRAIAYYKRYLAADPDGPAATVAAAHIAAMEAELRAEAEAEAARRKAAEEAEVTRQAEETRRRAEADDKARFAAKQAADRAVQQALADMSARDRTRRGRTLRFAGLATAGVGVVSAGASLVFGLRARDRLDEAGAARGTWTDAHARALDDGHSARTWAYVLGGTGGVLLVGGSTLYLLGRRAGGEAPPAVTPVPIAGGVGLSYGGTF